MFKGGLGGWKGSESLKRKGRRLGVGTKGLGRRELGRLWNAWGPIEQIKGGTLRTTIVDVRVLADMKGISMRRGGECMKQKDDNVVVWKGLIGWMYGWIMNVCGIINDSQLRYLYHNA